MSLVCYLINWLDFSFPLKFFWISFSENISPDERVDLEKHHRRHFDSEKSTGTNNKLIMAEFNLAASVSGIHTVDASSLLVLILLDLKTTKQKYI